MRGGGLRLGARQVFCRIAAAEGLDEGHLCVESACLQVGRELALLQHGRLGIQHHQLGAEACAVARTGQAVGALGLAQGGTLDRDLSIDAVQRGDLVSGVVQGFGQRLVVAGDGGVIVGVLAPQVGAQLAALEDRQLERRTCLLYTSPSPRDRQKSRMPSSA